MTFDEALVAALLAVNPSGLGGVALRCAPGHDRDQWLACFRQLLPNETPWRKIPLQIQDTALLGGLDLSSTLQMGRPVSQTGLLAQLDGGVAVLPMAERLSPGMAARLAGVMDTQEVVMERDGMSQRSTARIGFVAMDEGCSIEEQLPAALSERLAFHVELQANDDAHEAASWQADDIVQARAKLSGIQTPHEVVQALCAAAQALGVDSMRATLLALRTAQAAAALAGLDEVDDTHASVAARLVLAPRATRLPAAAAEEDKEEASDTQAQREPPETPEASEKATPPEPESLSEPNEDSRLSEQQLDDLVLAAAKAAIPPGLLAALQLGLAARSRQTAAGRAGAAQKSQSRGRPIGARRGEPRGAARLNVIETLRAAAPWQKLRASLAGTVRRVHVRREDFHVTRYKQLGQTTTVFVVDASGSSALNRLAEAKGAVELLLTDCYVRRDRVSVISFRGTQAELLLPPTRSLARAKRSLAGLPGGGGTPLATALDKARVLADQISRQGETPILVFLTDGRANIARDGKAGRTQAIEDALLAARELRAAGVSALLLDTAPTAQMEAQSLAKAMGARYLALPYAGSAVLSQAVKAATGLGSGASLM
jgi:magnesium chelatase subunit D